MTCSLLSICKQITTLKACQAPTLLSVWTDATPFRPALVSPFGVVIVSSKEILSSGQLTPMQVFTSNQHNLMSCIMQKILFLMKTLKPCQAPILKVACTDAIHSLPAWVSPFGVVIVSSREILSSGQLTSMQMFTSSQFKLLQKKLQQTAKNCQLLSYKVSAWKNWSRLKRWSFNIRLWMDSWLTKSFCCDFDKLIKFKDSKLKI